MKEYRIRIFIYVAAFIVTAVLTYLFKISDIIKKTDSASMGSAGLPVVYMISDEGMEYNFLYGHVSQIKYEQMHSVITPVNPDRIVNIGLRTYGEKILSVVYEVRNLSGDELIEKTLAEDVSIADGTGRIGIRLKNLITKDREYMLIIRVTTEKYEEISYYSRIVMTDKAEVDRKIKYVKKFCMNTMDKDTINEIISKLEPDSTGDNTNLGHVNIHSKLSQVGFGELNPILSGDIYPQIDEIDGKVASITLKYNIVTQDKTELCEYDVTEFYRINQVDENVTYVYSFDRFMEQKFNPAMGISDNGAVYLGIQPSADIQVKVNNTGTVTAFVINKNLWSYHPNRDRFNKVFSFEEDEADGFREENDDHDIRIVNIDNNGNIYFIVYGYMNRGIHEGELGMGVYYYDAQKNITEELVFIPSDDNYVIIEKSLDKLTYINDSKILYFYQNRSIYYLNYETKECMLMDSNVIPETCMMSDDYILVYQTGNNINDCNRIKMIDLKTGSNQYIDCEDKERIKVLGFIDRNIVYGIAEYGMIMKTGKFLMKSIHIIDDKSQILREYKENGIYITNTVFYESKIVIERAAYNDNDELENIEPEQLLSNGKDDRTSAEIKVIPSDDRQKEVYIFPPVTGKTVTATQTGKYIFPADSSVYINNEFDVIAEYYYVYTYGRLYYADSDFDECRQTASDTGGVVIDGNCIRIWDRYMDR